MIPRLMSSEDLLILSCVLGAGAFVEAVAGFGGTVLALSLGARWFGIEALLAWFLPLATWGAAGTGLGIGDPLDITRVLVVFALVAAACVRAERTVGHDPTPSRSGDEAQSSGTHPVLG